VTNETITERKDGVTVRIETKRGTGTRDQDKVSITGHYDSMSEAYEKRDDMKFYCRAMAEELRGIQPEEPEGEDDS